MHKRFNKNKLLLICLAAVLALLSSLNSVLASGVFKFDDLFRPDNDSAEHRAYKVTVDRKEIVPETAVIIVIHADADTGTELYSKTTEVAPGTYGPYSSMDFQYYEAGVLAADSDPAEGIISAGETKTITFEYTRIKYLVTYMPNGGYGSERTVSVGAGLPYVLLGGYDLEFSRSGFDFSNWNTQSDGWGTTYYSGQTIIPAGDLTVYMIWVSGV